MGIRTEEEYYQEAENRQQKLHQTEDAFYGLAERIVSTEDDRHQLVIKFNEMREAAVAYGMSRGRENLLHDQAKEAHAAK